MTDIVKVEQTELGRLVQRRAELEETVRCLKDRLKRTRPIDEAVERERRRERLEYVKSSIAERIEEAEKYAVAEIIDPIIGITNGLGAAEVELANIRRQIKAFVG